MVRGRWRRGLTWLGGLFLLAAAAFAIILGPTLYRVFHGLDVYETVAPRLPTRLSSPAVLLFSKTNGFRHEEAIPAARSMFRELARQRGWALVETDDAAIFNAGQLARFRTVVWNNVSGDVLTGDQRRAFRRYIEGGGGFVGIHAAGGDLSYRWRWYVAQLIGAQFIGHPMHPEFQSARILVEDRRHPITAGLPSLWTRTDEYYSFDRSVRRDGFHVLATLDEASYRPLGLLCNDLRMGADHPVMWTHCVGHGRVFYSALGHTEASYTDPRYRRLLGNAVEWTAAGGGCSGQG